MQNQNKLFLHTPLYLLRWAYFVGICMAIALLSGCTATRFLNEDESFYEGAEIKIQTTQRIRGQKNLVNNLNPYLLPKPNNTLLGSRPSVWFYYIAGTPKKEKGLRSFIKNKLGKPPVLLTDVAPEKITRTLEGEVNNRGYFGSSVTHEVTTRKKKSTITYTLALMPPYRLGELDYTTMDIGDEAFRTMLLETSLLKKGQRYQLERLKKEQERIEEVAKNNGYYFFADRYLRFDADSTAGEKTVDLVLIVERGTPAAAKRTYHVKNIGVFPNYILSNDSTHLLQDTVLIDGYQYIDDAHLFPPKIITDVINVRPDSLYKRINHEYSLSRLMGLKTFKFVNIKFTESSIDSSSLDATVYLTPMLKKSLRMQVQAVSKSNNFVGPGVELIFTNRNFFRGAEMFQFKLNTAYESQISRQQAGALNSIEFGADASITTPRFISPLRVQYRSTKYLPQTQFKIGYNFQQRLQYFRLTSFNISSGYLWRETTMKTHELFPAEISFIRSSRTSDAFNTLLEQNPTLSNSFQNQFIIGSRYSFTLNTQHRDDIISKYEQKNSRKSDFYFNATLEVAGNLLSAIQQIGGSNEDQFQLFGLPYSQFALASTDVRHYYHLNKTSKLVSRLALGVGYAYGNSTNLPYIKQFAVGGTTSLRAFPARSVGPGTYNVRTDETISLNTFFIDQRGDIKIEGNVEYRFDIFKALKGAVFADAGNIWLFNEDDSRPGSKFDSNKFLSEIAVGTGAGIRYDFNFFVLRFDLAFPIRKPFLEPNERWVFDDINFRSPSWRRQNLVLNIGIGYPF